MLWCACRVHREIGMKKVLVGSGTTCSLFVTL